MIRNEKDNSLRKLIRLRVNGMSFLVLDKTAEVRKTLKNVL